MTMLNADNVELYKGVAPLPLTPVAPLPPTPGLDPRIHQKSNENVYVSVVVVFRFSLPKGCQMEPGGTHKLCKGSVETTNVDFAFLTVITILKSLFYLAGRR